MKVKVVQRFALEERSKTVLARDSEIWTYGDATKRVLRYSATGTTPASLLPPFPTISTAEAALTWDGSQLIAGNRTSRKIYRINAVSRQETLLVDPASLDFGRFGRALEVIDAVIGDIAWNRGLLYLAVQAGYSSAIYGIDTARQRVTSFRNAPGPRPCGLDFDPADDALFTVDSRNRELRRFSVDDKEDIAELPPDWTEPSGLSFAADRRLWSVDLSTGDALQLQVEE